MALLAVLFGLAVQLRAWLDWRPLWLDEQMVARNIRDRDFAGLATVLDYNQAAPICWLWAQRLAVELAGTGERTLRAVPFLFAAGSLVLAWLAVRRWLGPVGAFTAVALFAVNSTLLRYAVEAKQYSGDVFWVLLLIVLGRWALASPPRPRRYLLWWSAAAVASLFSMGAILATPALALVLVGTAGWQGAAGRQDAVGPPGEAGWRGAWRLALRAALPSLLWLVAFGTHYWLTLRHLLVDETMDRFWAGLGYPPADAGWWGTLLWSLRRLEALAADPLRLDAAGLGRPWLLFAAGVFWLLVLAGIGVAMRGAARGGPPVGLLLAAPLVSGFLLALLQISPLHIRLAMWIMPGLFLAVGCALDTAARAAARAVALAVARRRALPRTPAGVQDGRTATGIRTWSSGAPARWVAGLAGAVTLLTAAVAFAPLPVAVAKPRPPIRFDYRGATEWLVARHRPGDLVVAVYGLEHAMAWYDPRGRLTPLIRVRESTDPACDRAAVRKRLTGHRRVILFADRRNPSANRSTNALSVLFAQVGTMVATADFGPRGVVGIYELPPQPPTGEPALPPAGPAVPTDDPEPPDGDQPCQAILN